MRRLLPPVDTVHVGGELGAGKTHVVDCDLLGVLLGSNLVLAVAFRPTTDLHDAIPVRVEDLLQSVRVHR